MRMRVICGRRVIGAVIVGSFLAGTASGCGGGADSTVDNTSPELCQPSEAERCRDRFEDMVGTSIRWPTDDVAIRTIVLDQLPSGPALTIEIDGNTPLTLLISKHDPGHDGFTGSPQRTDTGLTYEPLSADDTVTALLAIDEPIQYLVTTSVADVAASFPEADGVELLEALR
jgi:hypothetical protein